MEMSKLQTVALVVLTTILTDKFLINHSSQTQVPLPVATISTAPVATIAPASGVPTNTVAVGTPVPTIAPPVNTQNELILKEIQNLRKDMNSTLTNLQTKTTTQDSGSTLSPSLIGGMVKISSPQWKRVDVFERPTTSSKIINSIAYDVIYFYGQKSDGWYQLSLDGGQNGWVQSQFLKVYP